MKKLWKRFKNWLIYKLGGYVERTCVVRHHTITPVTLFSTIHDVDISAYHESETYKERVEEAVIYELAKYLYENRNELIDIRESGPNLDTFPYQTMSLQAIIKVCPKQANIDPAIVTFDKK